MDIVVTIKSIVMSLFVVGSVSLSAMEVETYKKSDDYSSLNNSFLFVQAMHERGDIVKDVAAVIVHKSFLVRMDTIYKKFDPFFHFHNDSYYKMRSDYDKNRMSFIDENPDFEGTDEGVIKKFNERYPYNINLCRKFDVLEPQHLIFLTKKQDRILSSLVNRPKCFHDYRGSYSFQFTEKENEGFLTLPSSLIELLSKYPKFVIPEQSQKRPFSDKDSDSYMDDIF